LVSLCANVLFLTEERNGKTVYHRDSMFTIRILSIPSEPEQKSIYDLYHDYFFRRQDHFGMKKQWRNFRYPECYENADLWRIWEWFLPVFLL
jgi:hypothetical protein